MNEIVWSFNPSSLTVGDREEEIKQGDKISVDFSSGLRRLKIRRANGNSLSVPLKNLKRVVMGGCLYNYNDETISSILKKYQYGDCICGERIMLGKGANIIGLYNNYFYLYCTKCKGPVAFKIGKIKISRTNQLDGKVIVIPKPHTVVGLKTFFNSSFEVLPGTFTIEEDKVIFYGRIDLTTQCTKSYRHTFGKDKIKKVKLYNGKELTIKEKDKPTNTAIKLSANNKNRMRVNINCISGLHTKNEKYLIVRVERSSNDDIVFFGKSSTNAYRGTRKVTLLKRAIESIVIGKKLYPASMIVLI